MKMHGHAGWEEFPSYLDVVVPRMLEFLGERNLNVTVFVVGQDAALERNYPVLQSIAAAGHEIGNHSFHHDTWLHMHPQDVIQEDIERAEECIRQATGHTPVGFRAPGYGLSVKTLHALSQRSYLYDASAFPNMLGPVAQVFFDRTSKLSKEEKRRRKQVFGTFRTAMRPLSPYYWHPEEDSTGHSLMEIPVTSMPIFRTPIHLTYLFYLSRFSPALAVTYFRSALLLCRARGLQPSILLHPPDFIGHDDAPEMAFFPGMTLTSAQKLKLLDSVLGLLARHFSVLPLRQHAAALMEDPRDNLIRVPVHQAPAGLDLASD